MFQASDLLQFKLEFGDVCLACIQTEEEGCSINNPFAKVPLELSHCMLDERGNPSHAL